MEVPRVSRGMCLLFEFLFSFGIYICLSVLWISPPPPSPTPPSHPLLLIFLIFLPNAPSSSSSYSFVPLLFLFFFLPFLPLLHRHLFRLRLLARICSGDLKAFGRRLNQTESCFFPQAFPLLPCGDASPEPVSAAYGLPGTRRDTTPFLTPPKEGIFIFVFLSFSWRLLGSSLLMALFPPALVVYLA